MQEIFVHDRAHKKSFGSPIRPLHPESGGSAFIITGAASDIAFFLKGFVLGFSIAAPVGPIGVLCIRRTLAGGMMPGFVTGLGAASADGVYGAIAAFGLASVTGFLVSWSVWFRLAGGIFLLCLGTATFLRRPEVQDREEYPAATKRSLAGNFGSTFFLTLANPMTIISFTAMFAGLGLGFAGGGMLSAALIVLGVILGSAAWWLTLSLFFSFFRQKIGPEAMYRVNRVSGAVIAGFGAVAVFSVIG